MAESFKLYLDESCHLENDGISATPSAARSAHKRGGNAVGATPEGVAPRPSLQWDYREKPGSSQPAVWCRVVAEPYHPLKWTAR